MDPTDMNARVMTKGKFMYKHGKDYETYEEANNAYCRTHGN
ncbi:9203_t:CDS:1, partial [Paraglomus brasilianum]